jgi:SH3-like domain-containing protein
MSMESRRVPRLGLLARLGFGGVLGIVVLVAFVTLDIRARRNPAPPVLTAIGKPTRAAPSESIQGLLENHPAAEPVEVTGSLPGEKAADVGTGPVSGLPMPRFVSLKTDRVNVRQGPTRDQQVSFVFQRAGLPVEVIAEFENWRRIRDSEGAEGWVLQGLLSGRRTALVAPWSRELTIPLHGHADKASALVAMLQPGVLASIKACAGDWCRISGDRFDGWIEQDKLWGAYPDETID